jgi:hypothetical protein
MRFNFPICLIILCLYACSLHKTEVKVISKISPASTIPNEIWPEKQKPCFNGAYYRKLVSSNDYWLGIEGKVVLPQIYFDETRRNPKKPQQYLDNPSVYLGGRMGGQETDIGLTWEVIKDEHGKVSSDRKAFRPFLRRTGHQSGQLAIFENAPAEKAYYWYPGEEVKLSLFLVGEKKIRFVIEGAGKKFQRDFDCDGYAPNTIGEFKRVNAIDQFANEGKPVQKTKTRVEQGRWKETNLYREVNGKVVAVPMKKDRYTEMMCPDPKYFSVKISDSEALQGGETIAINGAGY